MMERPSSSQSNDQGTNIANPGYPPPSGPPRLQPDDERVAPSPNQPTYDLCIQPTREKPPTTARPAQHSNTPPTPNSFPNFSPNSSPNSPQTKFNPKQSKTHISHIPPTHEKGTSTTSISFRSTTTTSVPSIALTVHDVCVHTERRWPMFYARWNGLGGRTVSHHGVRFRGCSRARLHTIGRGGEGCSRDDVYLHVLY